MNRGYVCVEADVQGSWGRQINKTMLNQIEIKSRVIFFLHF